MDPYGRGVPQPYPVTSPAGPYPGPPPGYVPAPAPIDTRNGTYNRKRPSDEPHTPTLVPPPPGVSRAEHDYRYPDPTTLAQSAGAVSPASSSASFQSAPQQANQQTPYYTQPTGVGRRPSPTTGGYTYESSRASSSPHSQHQGTPFPTDAASLRPPSNAPQSRTPPPNSAQGGAAGQTRPAMSISSIVSGRGDSQSGGDGASPGAGRSAADSDMLSRLR